MINLLLRGVIYFLTLKKKKNLIKLCGTRVLKEQLLTSDI